MLFLASFIVVRLLLWQLQDGEYCLKLNADLSIYIARSLGAAFLHHIKLFPVKDKIKALAKIWRNTWRYFSDQIDLASEALLARSRLCDCRAPLNKSSIKVSPKFNQLILAHLSKKIYRSTLSQKLNLFGVTVYCCKLSF